MGGRLSKQGCRCMSFVKLRFTSITRPSKNQKYTFGTTSCTCVHLVFLLDTRLAMAIVTAVVCERVSECVCVCVWCWLLLVSVVVRVRWYFCSTPTTSLPDHGCPPTPRTGAAAGTSRSRFPLQQHQLFSPDTDPGISRRDGTRRRTALRSWQRARCHTGAAERRGAHWRTTAGG
jgi:hypothetical protein